MCGGCGQDNDEMCRLLVYMHDGRGRETVEISRGSVAVGADVFAVEQIAEFKVFGEIFRHGNHVQGVARGSEDGADLCGPFLESLEMIMAVVKDDAGKSVINAVVDII